jgi:hypothetical protein
MFEKKFRNKRKISGKPSALRNAKKSSHFSKEKKLRKTHQYSTR